MKSSKNLPFRSAPGLYQSGGVCYHDDQGRGNRMETILVVDIQGDFTEWKKGSLAVPGTDEDYVRSLTGGLLLSEGGNRETAKKEVAAG